MSVIKLKENQKSVVYTKEKQGDLEQSNLKNI